MLDEQELVNYNETNNASQIENKNDVTSLESETAINSQISIATRSFKDYLFKPELLRAVMNCGFEHPSEVQQKFIPQAILGTDILFQAKSGMGKTSAFVLATLQQLKPIDGQISIIVICHTRELTCSIGREYERFCRYMPSVKVSTFFGGVPITNHEDVLKNNCPHIVLGTPGRILALIKKEVLNLCYIKHFILDSCDYLLESFDMRRDVQEIFKMTPHEKQVLMCSTKLSKEMRTICKKFMHNPLEIYMDDEIKLTNHDLRQYYIKLHENEKTQKLANLLDKLEFTQLIIFVKSVSRCIDLCKLLIEQNFPAIGIHSGMAQEERLARYKQFNDFQTRILITTDLFGHDIINIERVNIILHYDMPEDIETYLHRITRAGHFGRKCLVLTFVTNENDTAILNKVQSRFEVQITEMMNELEITTHIENR
ncbi:unnamed protein product [Adineta steineri]|uniref:RNA helicase n=1 Tax=Adineta steineri TaxID=433720 RepID=A0A813SJV0_9BILA|nr:unnamed protein product [Adineta steineri]CAF0796662.1 unnamed protein product [Adineta steineri]